MDLAEELTNLNDLRIKGILTDQEFERLKQALLEQVLGDRPDRGQESEASQKPTTDSAGRPPVVDQATSSSHVSRAGVVFEFQPPNVEANESVPSRSEEMPSSQAPLNALGNAWETAMSCLFGAHAVVALFAGYWCLVAGMRINRYLSGMVDAEQSRILEAADSADTWSLVAAGVWVFTAVIVIIWSYQVRIASETLWRGARKWSRGWTVGGFFVPVANLVIPKLALNESEKIALHYRRAGVAEPGWADRQPIAEGTIWWIGLIIAGLLSRLTGNLAEESLEEVRLLYFVQAGAFGLGALAQLFGISYVSSVSNALTRQGLAEARTK